MKEVFDDIAQTISAALDSAEANENAKLMRENIELKKAIEEKDKEISQLLEDLKQRETVIAETYRTHFRFSGSGRDALLDLIEIGKRISENQKEFDKIAERLC